MVKDRFYVKVDVFDGELDNASGSSMLKAIATALPGGNGLPEVFAMLPKKGQIAGSQRFTRSAFLGVRELERCISADYNDGAGATLQLFVMLPPDGSSTDAVWNDLAANWKAVPNEPDPVLAKKVPYRGLIGLKRTSKGIFGISGATDETTLIEGLSRF